MPEKSKRPLATTVGDGPFDVVRCDCNLRGCTAWHVLSGKKVVAVTQHQQVAKQLQNALYWAYHPASTHMAH